MKSVKIVLLLIAGLLLLVLFFPKNSTFKNAKPTPTAVKQQVRKFNLIIKDKKLAEGPNTLSVNQDDIVEISATSNQDGEFHLHGYDKEIELQKDKEALLGFTASISGRFAIELHGEPEVELGALEVQPK